MAGRIHAPGKAGSRDRERRRLAALSLASVQRLLEPGDDFFALRVGEGHAPTVSQIYDTDGKKLVVISHSAFQGWLRRGWVVAYSTDESHRTFAITPEGHDAVRWVGKVKAA